MKTMRWLCVFVIAACLCLSARQAHGIQCLTNANICTWGFNFPSAFKLNALKAFSLGMNNALIGISTNGSLIAYGQPLVNPVYRIPVISNAIDVFVGYNAASALTENGKVVVWGSSNVASYVPMPSDLSNVTALSAGMDHFLALKSNGNVACWGQNNYNQCDVPPNATNIIAIAAGRYHCLALKRDGSVVGWGQWTGAEGASYDFPQGLSNITAIAAGAWHSLALSSNGCAIVSGATNFHPTWSNVISIAAAAYEDLALLSDTSTLNRASNQTAWPWFQTGVIKIQAENSLRVFWVAGPVIQSQTSNLMVSPGSNVIMSITATSKTSIAYQWYFENTIIPSATNNVLSLSNVQTGNSGQYSAVLTDSFGSITSRISLTVQGPPVITQNPASAIIEEQAGIQFTSKVSSVSAYACQWYFNEEAIVQATNSILSISNISMAQSGNYYMIANNGFAAATSSVAILTVISIGIMDQSQQSNCSSFAYSAPGLFVAETFTPAISGKLNRILMPGAYIHSGTPRPITVHIVDALNGKPGTNILGRSVLHLESGDPRILFTNQNVFLEASRQYAFVLSVDTSASQGMLSLFPTSCGTNYIGGTGWQKSGDTEWQPLEMDFAFITRMIPGTPPVWLTTPQNGSMSQAGKMVIITAAGSLSNYPGSEILLTANGAEVARSNSLPMPFQWIPTTTGNVTLQAAILQSGTPSYVSDPVVVNIIPVTFPENDLFSQRYSIAGETSIVLASNTGASLELNEPFLNTNASRQTVWWEWTAPHSGLVTIETRPPFDTNMLISVFTGSSLDTLFAMSQKTGHCIVGVDAGTKYQIALDSLSSSFSNAPLYIALNDVEIISPTNSSTFIAPASMVITGARTASVREIQSITVYTNGSILGMLNTETLQMPFNFDMPGHYTLLLRVLDQNGVITESNPIQFSTTPANDHFTNSTEINGYSAHIFTSNSGATHEKNDPHGASNVGGKSIWYHWKAPDDGTCTVQGRGYHNFWLLLGAYVGDSLDTLTDVHGVSDAIGKISFQAVAGITYKIMVDAVHSDEGAIEWWMGLQPAHDNFAKRRLLRGTLFESVETSISATLETGETAIAPAGATSSLWWSWKAPVNGNLRITSASSSVPTQIGVYTGNSLNSLILLTNSGAGMSNDLVIHVTAGSSYEIGAFIMSSDPGDFSLKLAMDQLRIVSPIPGSVFLSPARLSLSSALDIPGLSVGFVEYFANGASIGIATQTPYVLNWTTTNSGPCTFTATARANSGEEFNSLPVSMLVYSGNEMPKPKIYSSRSADCSYALNAVGSFYVWGSPAGQFGLTSNTDLYLPQQAVLPPGITTWKQIIAVADGGNQVGIPGSPSYTWTAPAFRSWGLAPDGALYENGEVFKPFPQGVTNWTTINGGSGYALMVSSSGSVFVDGTYPLDAAYTSVRWVDAQCGLDFIALLDDRGNVGFLSVYEPFTSSPLSIPHPQGSKWTAISTSHDKLILKDELQKLFLYHSQGFSYILTPFELPEGVTNWVDFSGGGDHILALGNNGQIYQWFTSISVSNTPSVTLSEVQRPLGVTAWTAIAAGKNHSLAIGNDCRLYAWGKNDLGQLGSMPLTTQPAPVRVSNIDSLCGIPTVFTDGSARQQDDGTFRLRFTTDLNRTYLIQYSDDCQTWKTASQPVTGNGKSLDWIDKGPPLTETPPINKTRFYRVIFAD